MLRLLAKAIFGSSSRDDPWTPIIAAATEKAIDSTDPWLRAIYGYKDTLREPITVSLDSRRAGTWSTLPPSEALERL